MALVVETGTGEADSDAFVSLAYVDDYAADNGLATWSAAASSPADDKEAAIRRATRYLSTAFAWKGTKTNGRSQVLAFPRTDCTDGEGEEIGTDEIPVEIMRACCELAERELATPGYCTPDVVIADRVRNERVGPVSVEYAPSFSAEASRPAILIVQDIVGGLLAGSSNLLVGSAARS